MKYINIILTIFVAVGLFTSCYEDDIENVDEGRLSSKAYYTDEKLCEYVVNACYDPLQPETSYSEPYWVIGDIGSDDTEEGGSPGCTDIAVMRDFQRYDVGLTNTYLGSFWLDLYKGVSRTTALLVQTTAETVNSSFRKEKLDQYRGEAYFLRAFYYFDLVKVWGAVPMYTDILSVEGYEALSNRVDDSDDGSKQKRKVMDQVISDLREAVNLLPNKEVENPSGRATKQSAQALLAKALLFYSGYFNEDHYKEVMDLSDSVINYAGGIDACLPVKYNEIFTLGEENGDESIFEIQFYAELDYYGEGTIRNIDQAFRYIYLRGADGKDSISLTGEKVFFDNYINYGLNTPTKDLVSKFQTDAGTGNYDPRLDMIGKPGDSVYLDGTIGPQGAGFYSLDLSRVTTGYCNRKTELKYAPKNEWTIANIQNSSLNYPLIRMADVVLMGAEGAWHINDYAKATKYVNAVRERAQKSAQGNNNAEGTAKLPSLYTDDVSLEDIYLERRLELFCEGHRFFDVVRQGRADQVFGALSVDACGYPITWESYNQVMPIPSTQIVAHKGSLVQNPGY